MIPCYTWRGICCADLGGRLPEGAVPTSTPFDPLVLLVHRDPLHSRGIYAVTTPAEVMEPEGPGLLLPSPTGCLDPDLDPVILAHGPQCSTRPLTGVLKCWTGFSIRKPPVCG